MDIWALAFQFGGVQGETEGLGGQWVPRMSSAFLEDYEDQ